MALLVQIVFGWPAILASLALSGLGILLRRPALLVAGTVCCLGFALYLLTWPMWPLRLTALALPFLHLGGAAAVKRGRALVAGLLLLPHVGAAVFLAVVMACYKNHTS
ncbi:MAG TPA: hypothetical protein VGK74_27020 [Symbiobacteriaceae bacterium]|jgi:hypothetical protein